MAVTDFLNTTRDKAELQIALDVLREFSGHENEEEWAALPFLAWAKLEQLEEFLDHMVNGTDLNEDTKSCIEYTTKENRRRGA